MTGKKRKRADPNKAADVLEALFKKNGKSQETKALADQFQRYHLKLKWPAIVGKTIGEVSYPCAFSEGKLYVWVKNSTWLNQMHFARKELIRKINDYLQVPFVREIRLTLDSKDIPETSTRLQDPPV